MTKVDFILKRQQNSIFLSQERENSAINRARSRNPQLSRQPRVNIFTLYDGFVECYLPLEIVEQFNTLKDCFEFYMYESLRLCIEERKRKITRMFSSFLSLNPNIVFIALQQMFIAMINTQVWEEGSQIIIDSSLSC